MAFDPEKPINDSLVKAEELRANFNGLRDLIDTIPVGPQGPPGEQGPTGEISAAQLDAAISGTSSNSNGVNLMEFTISDPPTQWEVGTVYNKLNELIAALRRS